MKTFITILFLLLTLTGCFAQNSQIANSTSQDQKNARDPSTWDFGSIKKGQIVKHDFQIKNNLPGKLTINDVTTSCGCTASAARKKILAPGESTQITVEFNSKGYNGQTSQFVYVNTDDPADPIRKFTIKAFVR
jgi:hypothetical protein